MLPPRRLSQSRSGLCAAGFGPSDSAAREGSNLGKSGMARQATVAGRSSFGLTCIRALRISAAQTSPAVEQGRGGMSLLSPQPGSLLPVGRTARPASLPIAARAANIARARRFGAYIKTGYPVAPHGPATAWLSTIRPSARRWNCPAAECSRATVARSLTTTTAPHRQSRAVTRKAAARRSKIDRGRNDERTDRSGIG
jgi:hypothetical protein